MNTKLATYIALIALALVTSVSNAQLVDITDLTINIAEVKSIKINQSQFYVQLSFDNIEEVLHGKTIEQSNHLEITSTSDYEVKIFAATDLQGSNASIPSDIVKVFATPGDFGFIDHEIVYTEIQLTQQEQSIIQSQNGDVQRSFNIAYQVDSLEQYLDYPSDTYSTTITYSIVAN